MSVIEFDAAKKRDIVLIGRAAIDFNPNELNRTLDKVKTFSMYLGGSPANIAVGVNKLGKRVGFIGCVSNDQFGDFIINYFADRGIDTTQITRTSRMVSNFTGLSVQPNKAIVGANAFAHESGIHQDGVIKERTTYEIMDPLDVGIPSNKLVLGKHSGRHAFKLRLEDLGYNMDDATFENAFNEFKKPFDFV